MFFYDLIKKWRKKRRDRIVEEPFEDGAARIDIDPRAQKEINSSELIGFSCTYSTLSIPDEDSGLKCGVYRFGANPKGSKVEITVECSEEIDVGKKRVELRPLSILVALDEILKKYNVASHNGYYKRVSALPEFYGVDLSCEYSSGEKISCFDNEDVFLPVEFLKELCELFGVINVIIGDVDE